MSQKTIRQEIYRPNVKSHNSVNMGSLGAISGKTECSLS